MAEDNSEEKQEFNKWCDEPVLQEQIWLQLKAEKKEPTTKERFGETWDIVPPSAKVYDAVSMSDPSFATLINRGNIFNCFHYVIVTPCGLSKQDWALQCKKCALIMKKEDCLRMTDGKGVLSENATSFLESCPDTLGQSPHISSNTTRRNHHPHKSFTRSSAPPKGLGHVAPPHPTAVRNNVGYEPPQRYAMPQQVNPRRLDNYGQQFANSEQFQAPIFSRGRLTSRMPAEIGGGRAPNNRTIERVYRDPGRSYFPNTIVGRGRGKSVTQKLMESSTAGTMGRSNGENSFQDEDFPQFTQGSNSSSKDVSPTSSTTIPNDKKLKTTVPTNRVCASSSIAPVPIEENVKHSAFDIFDEDFPGTNPFL